jgi:hypothetical protein
MILFRLNLEVSQARRKDEDAPTLGHPALAQQQAVRDLVMAGRLGMGNGDGCPPRRVVLCVNPRSGRLGGWQLAPAVSALRWRVQPLHHDRRHCGCAFLCEAPRRRLATNPAHMTGAKYAWFWWRYDGCLGNVGVCACIHNDVRQ